MLHVGAFHVKKLRICDLFAGVGGLSLGAARAGYDVSLAVELDDRARDSHHLNFPNTLHSNADIGTLAGSTLLGLINEKKGALDGLIGGPPCQGFSTIGRKREGDERNDLFSSFFRLVNETRPRFFLAENVLGILDPKHTAHIEGALDLVRDNYQILGPLKVKASDYGAPTSRTRVLFVGFRIANGLGRDVTAAEVTKLPIVEEVVVRSALRGLPATLNPEWRDSPTGLARLHPVLEDEFQRSISNARPSGIGCVSALKIFEKGYVLGHRGTVHSREVETRYGKLAPGERDPITRSVRLQPDGFCPTLRAGTGPEKGSFQAVRPIHHRMPRVISPREAARLQSFPDWFVFHPTKWHSFRQLGNSVPPLLAEAILKNIAQILD